MQTIIISIMLSFIPIGLFPSSSQSTLSRQAEKAKQEQATAAREYKASLEKLLVFQEADVKSAEEIVQRRRGLVAQKIMDQSELDASIRALEAAKAKVRETKRQIAESDRLAGDSRNSNKGQTPFVRTPAPPNAEVVPLDVSDDKYIKDALSVMFGAAIAVSLGEDRVNEIEKKSHAIFKKYCQCTEAEYLDWRAGEGLPSIVHRMKEATLSRADQQQIENYNAQIGSLTTYLQKYNDQIESTSEMVEKRLTNRFEERKPEKARIDEYRIDFESLKFVKLVANEKPISIHDALTAYFGKYIQKKGDELRAETEKLRLKRQERPTRRKNEKRN